MKTSARLLVALLSTALLVTGQANAFPAFRGGGMMNIHPSGHFGGGAHFTPGRFQPPAPHPAPMPGPSPHPAPLPGPGPHPAPGPHPGPGPHPAPPPPPPTPWYYDDHPFATAAAVTAGVAVTTAVIGTVISSLPSDCTRVNINGVTYQQCDSTWYQPQYIGSTVQYVVVNPPR